MENPYAWRVDLEQDYGVRGRGIWEYRESLCLAGGFEAGI